MQIDPAYAAYFLAANGFEYPEVGTLQPAPNGEPWETVIAFTTVNYVCAVLRAHGLDPSDWKGLS